MGDVEMEEDTVDGEFVVAKGKRREERAVQKKGSKNGSARLRGKGDDPDRSGSSGNGRDVVEYESGNGEKMRRLEWFSYVLL